MNEQNVSLMAFTNGILDLHYSNLFLKRHNGKQYLTGEMNPLLISNGLQMDLLFFSSVFCIVSDKTLACSCSCKLNLITKGQLIMLKNKDYENCVFSEQNTL